MPATSKRVGFWIGAALVLSSGIAYSAEPSKEEVAKSLLQFGFSTGALLWESVKVQEVRNDGDRYTQLAQKLKQEMDQGRAQSTVVRSVFDVIYTGVMYEATIDPEPFSKAVSVVVAYGAKRAGDYFGDYALQQSQDRFLGALAVALKENNVTAEQLNNMSADQLKQTIDTIQIQGQAFRDILKDEPLAMDMLQANASDFAQHMGAAALLGVKELKGDVSEIASQLNNTAGQIRKLQENTDRRLSDLSKQMKEMQDEAIESKQAIIDLQADVGAARKATQTLSQISFLGWTTQQKLEAVKAGMFPDLSPQQSSDLRRSLEADLRRENMVRDLQGTARNIGELANIAANLGVDANVVTGLSIAQKGATAIAQYFTGDYLGAISTATSLVGVGKPDAAAERHAALMSYLDEQFKQINIKLNQIITLQQRTLAALNDLSQQVRELRTDVRRVEALVLLNHALLTKLVRAGWEDCWSLLGSMHGSFEITTKLTLIHLLEDGNTRSWIKQCNKYFIGKLRQWQQASSWRNEIIDARQFEAAPADETNTDAGKEYVQYISELNATVLSVRNFLAAVPDIANLRPAYLLARFSQPVVATTQSEMLSKALKDGKDTLDNFKCHGEHVLSAGLESLLCWEIQTGVVSDPRPEALPNLLGTGPNPGAQIGPNVAHLIDLGIALSTLVDFANVGADESWNFVSRDEITGASTAPSEALVRAIGARKGLNFLRELSTLADAYALQQSVLYGDYTAELILNILYDPPHHNLVTRFDTATSPPVHGLALAALKNNPSLARNVVMLGMRRTLRDKGYNLADGVTYYNLALEDYKGPKACKNSEYAIGKLRQMFPDWQFSYIAPPDEHGTAEHRGPLFECEQQAVDAPARGWGAAVKFDGFYVILPSPKVLSEGTYDYPPSFRVALAYRDKVAQALLDKSYVASPEFQSRFMADGNLALGVLNQTKQALNLQ